LSKIGNGICDGGDYVTEECSIDGGDCDTCLDQTGTEPGHIGDGYCDVNLNTTACNWDGGDCLGASAACIVEDKDLLGDGVCNGGEYNVEACDWDSGDCVACNSLVPEYQSIGELDYCVFSFFLLINSIMLTLALLLPLVCLVYYFIAGNGKN